MRSLKKAVAVGAVITLLGSTTAVYVSKNTEIQDRISKLYNIAEGYKNKLTTSEGKADDAQTELNAKKKILADLQTLLGAEGTSYDQLVAGINKKAKTMADTEFQNLINDMVDVMQLPTTDSEGNPITYDANKLAEEIMAYKDEIDALNDYVNNYAKYNNSEAYANMTLLQKLQSMINQLTQASDDAQAQLTLAEAKIVKLGHCPKDEGALTNGTCAVCGTHYDGAGTGGDISTDTGGGKENEQPSGGGSTGGTTQTTTCTSCGQTYTTGTTHTCPPAQLTEEQLRANLEAELNKVTGLSASDKAYILNKTNVMGFMSPTSTNLSVFEPRSSSASGWYRDRSISIAKDNNAEAVIRAYIAYNGRIITNADEAVATSITNADEAVAEMNSRNQ